MFCPSCGNQNPDQGHQCVRCGAALQAAPAPQKFKGTMMMSNAADMLGPGFGGPPPGAPRPASPPQPERPASADDMLDAPTIMQAPGEGPGALLAQRALLTQPQGTGNVNATMAMDASAFGLIGNGPGAPQSSPPPQEHGASTVAVDVSAFGLGGLQSPAAPQGGGWGGPPPQHGPQPGAWGQAPAPQAPAPQAPPPQAPPQPEISTGGIASTVAVDISQFGLGGGGPANPYGPPQGAQQSAPQGQQGYGGYPQQGMQQGMPQGMQQGMPPGMQQGGQQGMQQGMHPGMQQGMHPGMQQGMQPGWQPQGMSPLRPPPASVAPSGGNKMVLILGAAFLVVILGAAVAMIFLRH